jgi:Chaperone of endosialidase
MKTKSAQIVFTGLAVFLALAPSTQAVSPAPDGGYPGGNTAEGQNALLSLTTGGFNTAVGFLALRSDSTGQLNTGIGAGTLLANTADLNTATGAAALLSNTTGTGNTASGALALLANSAGSFNTACGHLALTNNTGSFNSALGQGALASNTTGHNNSASGAGALFTNFDGSENTATGFQALNNNTSGSGNNAVGHQALFANTIGNDNTAIGHGAGSNHIDGSGNVFIGEGMTGLDSEAGHTYIRNINHTGVSGGGTDSVTVDLGSGLIGHATSSRRYKEEIKPMDNASQALYRLKPVTYRYKKEIDPIQSQAFGLIAEEVAEINPGLVARNSEGQPESVHYEMVNAMLLNEFLKEHRTVVELREEIAALTATVKEQAAQIQKVNEQIELKKPAPQIADTNE